MKRIEVTPRAGWQGTLESQGFNCHTHPNGKPYWDESHYYSFTKDELNKLIQATITLHEMYVMAAEKIIRTSDFSRVGIPTHAIPLIRNSWRGNDPSLFGRFDLGYDGNDFKLLEYNADTPMALFEAGPIQSSWRDNVFPDASQFNNLSTQLMRAWDAILSSQNGDTGVHFAYLKCDEDIMTVDYLTCLLFTVGGKPQKVPLRDVGYDRRTNMFVDFGGKPIRTLFKLYPWENMLRDRFKKHLIASTTKFIEPAWKMLWSNKAILAILWEMFPDHPLLLPTAFSPEGIGTSKIVRKPFIGREGANIELIQREPYYSSLCTTGGPYDGPCVYQEFMEIPQMDGTYHTIGSWFIAGEPAGIGMREDDLIITGNLGRFVPHIIES